MGGEEGGQEGRVGGEGRNEGACMQEEREQACHNFLHILAAQIEELSVKLQFNTYEKWTKALK